MYKRLQELGIPSVLVRDEDIYLPKEERIRRILNIYGNSPNTILVSNHINAGGGEGAEVVYSLKNNSDLANLVLDGIASKGQIKRKVYQRRLPENPNKDYYYILRETGNTTPILIEYGFIDNKNDAYKLKNNLLDYVEGAVQGITTYLGYPYYEDTAMEEYIVKRGDTLYSLSKRFNISVDDIKKINNLDSDILSIGQILKFSEDSNNNSYDIYTVVKGDSLWKISKEFNIPVSELIEINNLSDSTIKVGQKLLINKNNPNTNKYIVKLGDTLWSIARENNISIDKLKKLNNLTSNLISVGQELVIE